MTMLGRGIRWVGAALALGVASVASAQESPVEKVEESTAAGSFGETGQLVISQELQFNLTYNTAGTDNFTIVLAPGADYFLRENLSVGAGVSFGQIFQEGEDATSVGLNVRLGYNLPYDKNLSLWPKLTVGFLYNKETTFLFGPDGTFFQLGAFAPIVLHPASHFFVGLGPNLDILLGDSEGLSFGVRSVVGGYF
ncbi:hypothetical protein [Pyxidicoccus fallax]|uniref:Outer membrane protein beta-barrel domain-containing protein n=2 Tax=Pyxidicoccus fallax TaxID=394095 RepID=A0A848LD98_9BACT|nr:hypothetical protein [Pyxidicoccus fallax]NMO14763.1 hypothetical protein [Pyxidicoccus fallax]